MLGSEIERSMGTAKYLSYYYTCVIGAAVAQVLVMAWMQSPAVPTMGASGGVFGLLLAFGVAFPHRRIILLIPPIPMPAWLFVTLYGAIELMLGVFGTQQGVAHFAHLGGMAAGFLLILFWRHAAR
jgi:membrane associated rhomboid family serine protease